MTELITTATSKDEADRAAAVAVLPVGSFEQHGPYLPLATDTIVACVIAREIAAHYPVLLLPPITIACSHEHAAWPGTVSISARTLHQVVSDVADSLTRSGVDHLVLVNGHGGNYVLSNIVQESSVHGPRMALFPSSAVWTEARRAAGMETSNHQDMHAGELETSLLLWSYPEYVRAGNESADFETERPFFLTHGLQRYTKTGVVGRPSAGTTEKGKAAMECLVAAAGRVLSELTEAGRQTTGDNVDTPT